MGERATGWKRDSTQYDAVDNSAFETSRMFFNAHVAGDGCAIAPFYYGADGRLRGSDWRSYDYVRTWFQRLSRNTGMMRWDGACSCTRVATARGR